MRRKNYEAVRFALFAQSYAGYYFTEKLKISKDPDKLAKRLADALLFNENFLLYFLSPKYSKREIKKIMEEITEEKNEIKMYLCIENELILLANAKRNRSDYNDSDYEDEMGILSVATERAVGNCLSNIRSDDVFEQQFTVMQGVFRKTYYKIAWKYKLPTLRIIPFITRLITPRKL